MAKKSKWVLLEFQNELNTHRSGSSSGYVGVVKKKGLNPNGFIEIIAKADITKVHYKIQYENKDEIICQFSVGDFEFNRLRAAYNQKAAKILTQFIIGIESLKQD
jgi:hypothetical protein